MLQFLVIFPVQIRCSERERERDLSCTVITSRANFLHVAPHDATIVVTAAGDITAKPSSSQLRSCSFLTHSEISRPAPC